MVPRNLILQRSDDIEVKTKPKRGEGSLHPRPKGQGIRDPTHSRSNKKTGMLSDPDAGHYVKKTGTYSVLSGTGYTDTCVVDSWWGLSVYWDAVNESKNDNTIFKETTIKCMKSETHKPLFMVADAGPDSHTSNQVVIDHGVIPIIAARTKCPQRNNLCNLLVIGISIGDLDCENQDVQ